MVSKRTRRVAELFATIFAFLCSIALVQLTLWKESELFWIDAGGYPLWLRDTVRTLYYPYLFFICSATIILSRSIFSRVFKERKIHKTFYLLTLTWIVFFSCLGLLLANNLINLLENKPIHYHDWERAKEEAERFKRYEP